uniref:Uncharacterized protein n=1 Tax=Avena sativa TaxID=4498 RepID=A0ACD5WRU6_AVESA
MSRTTTMEGESKKKTRETAGAKTTQPALPWKVRLQVLALEVACDLSQRRDGTVNRFLFSLTDRQTRASLRPDARGVRSADIAVDPSRNLWARVYSPAASDADQALQEAAPLPVIVYFHGGGFVFLSPASKPLDAMSRHFCRELGAVLVSVNYRLAPEHRYPAAYDDCVDVLRFLDTNGLPGDNGVRVDLSRCFLAGDSAGGNIVHHVAQRFTSSASPPTNNPVRLAGIILLQPYFGGEERTESELRLEGAVPVVNLRRSDWSWRAFLPVGANRNHPAAHVTGEAGPEPELGEAFPPAMVVVGGLDPLQDWQRRYAAMLRRKRKSVRVVEFPDAMHTFYMFSELPDAGKLVEDVKSFMQTNMSDH